MGKFGSKRSKLFILTENWHTEYLEDANSYSVNSFLNILPEIYFLANLGQKSQLFVLPENQHTGYLEDANCYCNISFLNFQPFLGKFWLKKSVCFAWKITHTVSRGLWFLFLCYQFSQISNINLEYADSYSRIIFMKFQT